MDVWGYKNNFNKIFLFPSYCGSEAPKFSKTDFEKGKARWLVVFNNTGNKDNFTPQVALEAPTIGYRSKIYKTNVRYGV